MGTNELRDALLQREGEPFYMDLKAEYEIAQNDAAKRGLIGSGVGIQVMERAIVSALKQRCDTMALELAEIETKEATLANLLEETFEIYDANAKRVLAVAACWGKVGEPDQKNREATWNREKKEYLKKYYGSQFRVALFKRKLSKKYDFRKTLFWTFVGAFVGALLASTSEIIQATKEIILSHGG